MCVHVDVDVRAGCSLMIMYVCVRYIVGASSRIYCCWCVRMFGYVSEGVCNNIYIYIYIPNTIIIIIIIIIICTFISIKVSLYACSDLKRELSKERDLASQLKQDKECLERNVAMLQQQLDSQAKQLETSHTASLELASKLSPIKGRQGGEV